MDSTNPTQPLGDSHVGVLSAQSTFFTAARVAEAAGRAQARGDARRCSRNSRDVVTAGECLERFRGGDPVCVNEFHGRCSTGALEVSKEEKTMANYGTCIACGKKGNRDKDDHCYRQECKKERGKVQAEPFEKIEELPDQDHFPQAGNMVDLPEDLDRPFSLGGFDFEPAGPVRPVGKRSVSIRQDTVCFLAGTVQEHDLGRYTHARMTASKDGRAIAVKFYSAARDGANQLQNTGKVYRTLAAKTFLQSHPSFRGKKAVLESVGIEGWFLMRMGEGRGEAA